MGSKEEVSRVIMGCNLRRGLWATYMCYDAALEFWFQLGPSIGITVIIRIHYNAFYEKRLIHYRFIIKKKALIHTHCISLKHFDSNSLKIHYDGTVSYNIIQCHSASSTSPTLLPWFTASSSFQRPPHPWKHSPIHPPGPCRYCPPHLPQAGQHRQ